MKQYKTGRVLAALFLGVMFGVYHHLDEIRWLRRGRDAFLASQSLKFDNFTQYHTAATMLIAGVILAALVFGLYELIAAGITKVLPPGTAEE